jgi:hypothetical protein
MDLVLGPQTTRSRRRRPWIIVAVAVLAAAVLGGCYLAGRAHPSAPGTSTPVAGSDITWSAVGPWPVPASASAGPREVLNGVAAGYSHDELGAALAAFNITFQLTSDAGPQVYDTTARQQTYGDVDSTLAQISMSPTGGSSPATEFYYKIIAGDPSGSQVLVSIAQRTAESTQQGGYAVTQRTLSWINSDWRMQVPMPTPQIVQALPGYTFLGGPHV